MKRMVAQLIDSSKPDYDADERGEVVSVGTHHGGNVQLYIAHKITKLREMHKPGASELAAPIFKDCIIFINGLTDPPVEELRRLIKMHGGECIMYRAVKITHYVCNHFTDAQLKHEYGKIKLNAKNKVHNVKVAWVMESIKQGRRLDENQYSPSGLRRHGNDISNIFLTNAPASVAVASSSSSSSSSSTLAENNAGSSPSNSTTGRAVPLSLRGDGNALTASQEVFVESVPPELRAEVLQQLSAAAATSAAVAAPRSTSITVRCGEVESNNNSSRSDISACNGCERCLESECDRALPAVRQQQHQKRQENLRSMIDCVHFQCSGGAAAAGGSSGKVMVRSSSKTVTVNLRTYIHTLLSSLSPVTVATTTAVADGAVDEEEEEEGDQRAAAEEVLVVQSLLCDYGAWLVQQAQFEQVQLLCDLLHRQCKDDDGAAPERVELSSTQCEEDENEGKVSAGDRGQYLLRMAEKVRRYLSAKVKETVGVPMFL